MVSSCGCSLGSGVDNPNVRKVRADRYPLYDPAVEPYVNDPFVELRSNDDVQGVNSPYVINCQAGRLIMKVNQLGGGTVHYISITGQDDVSDNIGGYGFGRGVWNSAIHVINYEGYNPQTAGYCSDVGPEVPVTDVTSGRGKGFLVDKFRVPLNLNGRTGYFSRNVDIAVGDMIGGTLDTTAYPETKYLDTLKYGQADLIDEDALGWTQFDEICSEFSAASLHTKWDKQAGIPAIRIRWYWAYEKPPKAMLQFEHDADKDAQQISGEVRPFPGMEYDICGLQMGSGMRIEDKLYPEMVGNAEDELIWTHYALDVVDPATLEPIMYELPDYGGPVDRPRVAWTSWSDILDPKLETIILSADGKRYPPAINRDPTNPDHKPNGDGAKDTIALAIIACSNDPTDDRALGVYAPRTAMNRYPIEGWGKTDRKLKYRDNRRHYFATQVFADGGLGVGHGASIHMQTRLSGMFARREEGPFADVVEVAYAERIFLRGTPKQIRDACRTMEDYFLLEVDAKQIGELPGESVGAG